EEDRGGVRGHDRGGNRVPDHSRRAARDGPAPDARREREGARRDHLARRAPDRPGADARPLAGGEPERSDGGHGIGARILPRPGRPPEPRPMPARKTLRTGPCGAGERERLLGAPAGPTDLWLVPTPLARAQVAAALARPAPGRAPRVWCWDDLWRVVREGRD